MKERKNYLDYLRILSAFSVVVLHVSAQNWYSADIYGFEWNMFNIYDSIFRFGVPVFVMISGALMLDKDINIKKLYSKNILRLIVSFLVWSTIYGINYRLGFKDTIKVILLGHFHMWYIFLIIGIYILVPVFSLIAQNEKVLKYSLIVFLALGIFIPTVYSLINDFGKGSLCSFASSFIYDIQRMSPEAFIGYPGFFLLGYYLDKKEFSIKQRIALYIAGIIGVLATILLTVSVSRLQNTPSETYYSGFMINVFLVVVALFVGFKYAFKNRAKENRFIKYLSVSCYGVYLVHPFVMESIDKYLGVNTLSFNTVLSVPILSLIIFLLSMLISMILNRIPKINKYIV